MYQFLDRGIWKITNILLYEKYTRNDEKNSVHNFIFTRSQHSQATNLTYFKKKFYLQSIHPSSFLKMLQEISIIVYYLRTTQFSICHLSLSLPQIHSTQPLYPPIFIHPFNERKSKFQASHPRISFDRELKGIDWITPKAPSWFSTSFDFSNRNRTSEEICRFPDFTFPFSAQHPANWMLKSKFFPKRTRKDGGLNEVKKVGEFPEIL